MDPLATSVPEATGEGVRSMKSRRTVGVAAAIAGCGAGLLVAFASPASADPAAPVVPPPSLPAPVPPAPGAPQPIDLQAAGPEQIVPPPNGTPHLASPDALPPGSTMDPSATTGDSPDVSYFKNLWQAVQNHEISGKQALIMGLAQRGMSTPIPDQAPGPNVPTSPADAAPPPAPALGPAPAVGPAPAPVPPPAPAPLIPPPPAP
jgi:hypothetical protein